MLNKTNIAWTDGTWNPIRGCTRVSEGCRYCYAEQVAYRFSGPGLPYEGLVRLDAAGERRPEWNGQVRFVEEHLLDPLKLGPVTLHTPACLAMSANRLHSKKQRGGRCGCGTRPRRIFVNSMSDLFHEGVTDEQLDRIFAVMALCPDVIFQVLTKRPERMREYLRSRDEGNDSIWMQADSLCGDLGYDEYILQWPLPNVWLGVSVEDQKTADARIPLLLQTPAAVRFISAEPLLGSLHIQGWLGGHGYGACSGCTDPDPLGGTHCEATYEHPLPAGLDWVIVGGESGREARPMHPAWAREIRDQCLETGTPLFFKQQGEWLPHWGGGTHLVSKEGELVTGCHEDPRAWQLKTHEPMRRVGTKAAGDLLDGRQWHEFPQEDAQ